jgi:hypothetical protein
LTVSAVATADQVVAGIERPQRGAHDRALFDDGVTFEDVVLECWEALIDGSATCLVCGGSMQRAGCSGCGSELT